MPIHNPKFTQLAEVTKLVSRLRVPVSPKHRKLSNPEGPEGRLKILRATLTALLKYERIEVYRSRGDEVRGYVERLISDSIRYGDCHKETMDMANYWIEEKNIIHKLFKVLVPRFESMTCSYTKFYAVPGEDPSNWAIPRSVLELRGNPFPPLVQNTVDNKLLIQNVLLDEAKKEYRAQKYAEIANKLEAESTGQKEVESSETTSTSNPVNEAKSSADNTSSSDNDYSSVVIEKSTENAKEDLNAEIPSKLK